MSPRDSFNISRLIIHSSPRSTNRTVPFNVTQTVTTPRLFSWAYAWPPSPGVQCANPGTDQGTTPVKNSLVPRILAIKPAASGSEGASNQPLVEFCRANHTKREATTSSINARTVPASRPADGVEICCLFAGRLIHVVPCMEV
ncbi:hypothetical protein P168DRAFT_285993 [Aspergillus campestris IBT 28561]|uniref:Uncharacterized protein n=1 Tax=Aspergillus campestris (strain IBT 28561) TaxID=1392248 RepID=A0A2I1DD54_ASPC2|nr:uncharacterized protein P168DRAFT_285993 [Aspergillus campestris IBT 28561]PKY07804.1 hypothetical protein P168DRAFT_285993 [Aspergillus campestris IBT 28561]